MARFDDWPERLLACIDAARARPFAWGQQDCALFAADCVRAMTGVDPAASYRGAYRDRRRAYTLLRRRAGDLPAACTAALGAPLAHPAFAQRGDVVLIDSNQGLAAGVVPTGGPATGVVVGGAIAAAGLQGVIFLPPGAAIQAWRV